MQPTYHESLAMPEHFRTPEGRAAYVQMLRERCLAYVNDGLLLNENGEPIAVDPRHPSPAVERIRTDDERDDDERNADLELLAALVRRWGRERIEKWLPNVASVVERS